MWTDALVSLVLGGMLGWITGKAWNALQKHNKRSK